MDGSRGHIHQITNFTANEEKEEGSDIIIQPRPDSSNNNNNNILSINGTADIKINGISVWKRCRFINNHFQRQYNNY